MYVCMYEVNVMYGRYEHPIKRSHTAIDYISVLFAIRRTIGSRLYCGKVRVTTSLHRHSFGRRGRRLCNHCGEQVGRRDRPGVKYEYTIKALLIKSF